MVAMISELFPFQSNRLSTDLLLNNRLLLITHSYGYDSLIFFCSVVYQLHLLSTQSDLYYIGLNAIEFFDSEGKKIQLDENSKYYDIHLHPENPTSIGIV